jgi:hypothetical protein
MNINTVILKHRSVCNLIVQRKVRQSFEIMSDMLENVSVGDLRDHFSELQMTYRNILRYTVEGIHDPERQKVYNKLLQKYTQAERQNQTGHFGTLFRVVHIFCQGREQKEEGTEGRNIIQSVDDLVFKSRLDDLLASAEISRT